MKCWLCERDDFSPGEIKQNAFGDPECIYCTDVIHFTVVMMNKPEIIPLVRGIKALPRVDGVSVGIKLEAVDDAQQ